MMLLNLVSREIKRKIKLNHVYENLKKIFIVLFVLNVCLAIVVFSAKVIAKNNFEKIKNEIANIDEDNQKYYSEVSQFNNNLKVIKKIQNEHEKISAKLSKILKEANEGIHFNYINFDKEKNIVKIKGIAQSRENLLSYRNNLAELEFLNSLDLPMDSIISRHNVQFNIQLRLNP